MAVCFSAGTRAHSLVNPRLAKYPGGLDDSVIVAQKTFRETQWFKLGQVEQESQDQHGDDAEPSDTLLPIEDRYSGSSITIEDSLSFGLHTGQTEAIKISFKTVSLPDEVPMALLV